MRITGDQSDSVDVLIVIAICSDFNAQRRLVFSVGLTGDCGLVLTSYDDAGQRGENLLAIMLHQYFANIEALYLIYLLVVYRYGLRACICQVATVVFLGLIVRAEYEYEHLGFLRWKSYYNHKVGSLEMPAAHPCQADDRKNRSDISSVVYIYLSLLHILSSTLRKQSFWRVT